MQPAPATLVTLLLPGGQYHQNQKCLKSSTRTGFKADFRLRCPDTVTEEREKKISANDSEENRATSSAVEVSAWKKEQQQQNVLICAMEFTRPIGHLKTTNARHRKEPLAVLLATSNKRRRKRCKEHKDAIKLNKSGKSTLAQTANDRSVNCRGHRYSKTDQRTKNSRGSLNLSAELDINRHTGVECYTVGGSVL